MFHLRLHLTINCACFLKCLKWQIWTVLFISHSYYYKLWRGHLQIALTKVALSYKVGLWLLLHIMYCSVIFVYLCWFIFALFLSTWRIKRFMYIVERNNVCTRHVWYMWPSRSMPNTHNSIFRTILVINLPN